MLRVFLAEALVNRASKRASQKGLLGWRCVSMFLVLAETPNVHDEKARTVGRQRKDPIKKNAHKKKNKYNLEGGLFHEARTYRAVTVPLNSFIARTKSEMLLALCQHVALSCPPKN